MKRTPMKRAAFKRSEVRPTHARTEVKVKAKLCSAPDCETRFIPARMGQKVCGTACAMVVGRIKAEKQRQAEARADRVKTRAKLETLKSVPKLIAEAQATFNAFIRERDREKGCFVCLRPFDQNIPGRALHAGHVRSRGAAGHLRFDEDNCMGECEGCNGPRGAKPHQIKAGAIARIGAERFAELEANNTPHKWTSEELRAIRDTYRAKVREMKRVAS